MKTLILSFGILLSLTLLSGCAGYRYLKVDEKLLHKQKITSGKVFDNYTISQLFVQEANVKFPPYGPMYMRGLAKFDSSKYLLRKEKIEAKYDAKMDSSKSPFKLSLIENKKLRKIEKVDNRLKEGNNLMQWGEPLAIFDSTLVIRSKDNISQFLFNKGFFNNNVDFSVKYGGVFKRKDKKVVVEYQIKENKPFRIDTVFLRTQDSLIMALLKAHKGESLLIKGKRYDQGQINKERERVEYLLKDNGYYNFSRQFIAFDLDTVSSGKNKVAIRMRIVKPTLGKHKQYRVDSVNMVINASYDFNRADKRATIEKEGIVYSVYEDIFSPKVMNRRIFIRTDSLYSRENMMLTQRQLANLDNFKFININYDSSGGRFIANIFTSPLDRYQWSHEVGVNMKYGEVGPFYNLSFIKRNIFRRLENFEFNTRISSDKIASATDVENRYGNAELGITAGITFPQFLLPLSSNFKNSFGDQNPKTRLSTSYTFTHRLNSYTRQNYNFTNNLTWQNKQNTFFNVALTDISIISSEIAPDFESKLSTSNKRLINSFLPSYVSGMSFNLYQNLSNSSTNPSEKTSYYRLQLESGGTHLNFFGKSRLENLKVPLEYFQYVKLEADFSKSKPLSSSSSIAFRFNAGAAFPYGDNKVLPYEKYFFAGGSNGIRAWRPRRLGPGGFVELDDLGETAVYDLEQQGDILIQSNLEFRSDLIGFIDYALFIDAGNIWTWYDDPNRENENFSFNQFYKQLAIGTGMGLRFDFSFLILRVDAGIKTYDPARPEGNRWVFGKNFNAGPIDYGNTLKHLVVINLGVGYPF